mgnify:FL=1
MGLVVYALQALRGHVGINLRGIKRGVPQQFLHYAQICPAFQKVGCGRVAHPVRGKPLSTSDLGGLFYNAAHLALIDAPSPAANKDRFSFSRGDFSTAFVNPLL